MTNAPPPPSAAPSGGGATSAAATRAAYVACASTPALTCAYAPLCISLWPDPRKSARMEPLTRH